MTRAALNVFQKTQRLWETAHPYNAAQAMEWSVPLDPAAVHIAFAAAIEDLGLGGFPCDERTYTIDRTQPPPPLLRSDDFETFLTAEMNRPFAAADFPFRPFQIDVGERCLVGLTYRHWVADSVSVRLLTRQWLLRLTGGGGPHRVRLPAGGLLNSFGPATAGWSVVAQAASLFGFASRMKSMRRVETKTDDDAVAVRVHPGPDGLMPAVRSRARAQGRTVGDVLLAAATEACAAHGPTTATARRSDIAMGTIVDLRARGDRVPADVFGLYLGFTMTPFSFREAGDFARLLARTARERRTGLARRSAEASQLNMWLGYLIARRSSPAKLREFYRKRFPLAGGLSSVNMTPGWAGQAHPNPLAAYHRVSPTGPLLPVVLTPTTLGESLRVCCTYRTALMDRARADALIQVFLDRVIGYADSRLAT